MSGEVQKHLRARKKNKPKNLHKQSPVAVYKSLWTPTKEISSNLLGRDTALSTKDPEQRQIIFCWLKWSSLPLKGRPRTFFFFPFHSLLSNASYTSLRISGLYYKHTAISFKRCSVFPLIIQSSNIHQNASIFVTQFQSFCHCCYYFPSSCSTGKKNFISYSQQSFLKGRYSTYLWCQNLSSTAHFSLHGKLHWWKSTDIY